MQKGAEVDKSLVVSPAKEIGEDEITHLPEEFQGLVRRNGMGKCSLNGPMEYYNYKH